MKTVYLLEYNNIYSQLVKLVAFIRCLETFQGLLLCLYIVCSTKEDTWM